MRTVGVVCTSIILVESPSIMAVKTVSVLASLSSETILTSLVVVPLASMILVD